MGVLRSKYNIDRLSSRELARQTLNKRGYQLSLLTLSASDFRLHSHIKGHLVHHLTAIPREINRTRARPLQSRETGWWRVMKNIFKI